MGSRIENDLLYVRQGTLVEEMVGWQDYNDLATQTTPISLSVADRWYELTNDGLGPYTNTQFRVLGKPEIWDTTTNSFRFTDLFIGGIQIIRTSVYVTAPHSNTEISMRLRFAIGSPLEYSIPIETKALKSGGKRYHMTTTTFFTIDNRETVDNPGKIECMADVSGTEVEVEGWKILTLDRF